MANTAIVTPVGKTSFLKVFKAEPNMNGTANLFSLKLLLPKETNMDWIKTKWEEVCMDEFKTKTPGGLRPLFSAGNPFDDKGAIMDGDWKYDNTPVEKKDTYESYRGCWVFGLNAPEAKPPMVVGADKVEIMNQGDLQSGDYVRCVIELSSYTSKKYRTPQVSITLKVVQKDRTGERFGGGMASSTALDMLSSAAIDDI